MADKDTAFAAMSEELADAHQANKGLAEANGVLTIQRDAAEAKYVKVRDDNSDLEDQVISTTNQHAILVGKYQALRSALASRLWHEVWVGLFVIAVTVGLTLCLR